MEQFQGEHAELTEQIIGVFYRVARELGFGFMEKVYRRSMLIALKQAGLRVEEEVAVPVYFSGECVGMFFADLVVENLIVLELKTAEEISKAFEAQVLHYLRSSRMEIGFVLCFGERPKFKRVSMTNDRKAALA